MSVENLDFFALRCAYCFYLRTPINSNILLFKLHLYLSIKCPWLYYLAARTIWEVEYCAWAAITKYHRLVNLNDKFISHSSGAWKVQNQGSKQSGFWWGISRSYRQLPSLCLPMAFLSTYTCGERGISPFLL